MRSGCNRLAASLVVAMGASLGGGAKGASITAPWSGASASADFNATSDSQQGATASAHAGGSNSILTQAGGSDYTFHVKTSGEFGASAGADPAHLLRVNASYQATGAGVKFSVLSGGDGADVSAAWTNDAVVVSAPAGSGLPDVIRLNFTLTLDAPGTIPYSTLTATVNDKSDVVSFREVAFSHGGYLPDPTQPIPLDSSESSGTRLTDTFHVDLPLDASGRSAPFNLALALNPPVGVIRTPGGLGYNYDLTGNLALSSVTLPDGTALASIGASATFDSGLASPNAVPEPASLVLWACAALGGLGVWARKKGFVK